tara:strand:+ start:116 stop:514 length:399 start_codon:yes stop_codon:yes gene_type:complete
MKVNSWLFFLFLIGCSPKETPLVFDIPIPPPPPPPSIVPSSVPPQFTPSFSDVAEIQVNPIPHPFNLNGELPFAVWVDGKLLPLDRKSSKDVANFLGLKFTQPEDTAEIHNGEGWLYPLDINKNDNSELSND